MELKRIKKDQTVYLAVFDNEKPYATAEYVAERNMASSSAAHDFFFEREIMKMNITTRAFETEQEAVECLDENKKPIKASQTP